MNNKDCETEKAWLEEQKKEKKKMTDKEKFDLLCNIVVARKRIEKQIEMMKEMLWLEINPNLAIERLQRLNFKRDLLNFCDRILVSPDSIESVFVCADKEISNHFLENSYV